MILNWIVYFLLFWHFSRQIQGLVTTKTNKKCSDNCTEGKEICGSDKYCHCYTQGDFYTWNGTDCITGEDTTKTNKECSDEDCSEDRYKCMEDKFCHCVDEPFIIPYIWGGNGCIDAPTSGMHEYLKIPASESDSFFDLIQMRGLECGEKSTGRYRMPYIDGLPGGCINAHNLHFLDIVIRMKADEIMHGNCELNGLYIPTFTAAQYCKMRKNPFQMTFFNSSDQKVAEINITTTNDNSTMCHMGGPLVCNTITEIRVAAMFKFHPDCVTKIQMSTDQCPLNVNLPVVEVIPSSLAVQIHGSATIYCRFLSLTYITKVEWLKGDFPVNNNMVETSITDNMSTLTIDNIEPVNEGEYQCVVSNINGIASATVNVKIERELPVVQSWIMYNRSEFKPNLSANDSERVELVCSVTAFPPEKSIIWIKDKNGKSYKIDRPISNPNLIFDVVDLKDEGKYTCSATNEMGTEEGNTLTLHVITTETMCPCSCGFKAKVKKWRLKNLSKEEFLKEMEPLMNEVLDNMKMDKSQISAVIRKLTSAPDDRKSSKQIGSFGMVIIVGAFALIIIFDILSCIRFRSQRRE